MAGPTNGQNNPQDYVLPRGELFFAALDASRNPVNWRFLGNAPEMAMNVTTEELKHYSSTDGVRRVDLSLTTQQDLAGSFSLEEANNENMALFFAGSANNAVTNPAIAGITKTQFLLNANIVSGRWYDILDGSGNQARGVTVANLTLENDNGSPVAYVNGTDYLLDADGSRIFLMPGGQADTDAGSTENIDITVAANGSAPVITQVRALQQDRTNGALRLVVKSPTELKADGTPLEITFDFHDVDVRAEGDFSGIAENEWSNFPFAFSVNKSTSALRLNSPYLDITTRN